MAENRQRHKSTKEILGSEIRSKNYTGQEFFITLGSLCQELAHLGFQDGQNINLN